MHKHTCAHTNTQTQIYTHTHRHANTRTHTQTHMHAHTLSGDFSWPQDKAQTAYLTYEGL